MHAAVLWQHPVCEQEVHVHGVRQQMVTLRGDAVHGAFFICWNDISSEGWDLRKSCKSSQLALQQKACASPLSLILSVSPGAHVQAEHSCTALHCAGHRPGHVYPTASAYHPQLLRYLGQETSVLQRSLTRQQQH